MAFDARFRLLAALLSPVLFLNVAGAVSVAGRSDADAAAFEAKRTEMLNRPRTVVWKTDGNDMVLFPRNLPRTREAFESIRLKYVEGTKIDTVLYCPHSSAFGWFTARKVHDFMTSDIAFDDGTVCNAAADFARLGTDALEMAVSYCRRKGLEIFVSIRMNDTHDHLGLVPPGSHFSRFKRRHPECLIGSMTNPPPYCSWTAVDYAQPAVREHVRRFVREFLENYDVDGIEYDFFQHLQLLKTVAEGSDATPAELAMMTELMRQLREIAEEAGRKRGRPFLVAVRVPDSPGFCRTVGIDIERWMDERLVDIVTASGYFQLNPWHVMANRAHRSGCRFYAAINEPRRFDNPAQIPLGILPGRGKKAAFYRAREAAAMADGADGVVLFNLERGHLPTIANIDPRNPGGKTQDYFAVPRAAALGQFRHYCANPDRFLNMPPFDPQRPRRIGAGETYSFDLVLGDDPAAYPVPRKVTVEVLTDAKSPGALLLSVNGTAVARTSFAKRVFSFDVPATLVGKGANRMSISARGGSGVRVADFVLRIAEAESPGQSGTLCLTFDDRNFDAWERHLPLFRKYGAHATFFVCGPIDDRAADCMRRLAADGHSIGLHGLHHRKAPALLKELGEEGYFQDEIQPQLAACRAKGIDARSFAYPYSARNGRTDKLLLGHFKRLRSSGGTGVFARDAVAGMRMLTSRGSIGSRITGTDVALALQSIAVSNAVLVTCSHSIEDKATTHSMSSADLETVLAAASRLGVAMLGFDELPLATENRSDAVPVTAGWENVNPARKEFPPARVLWTAGRATKDDFKIERRDGAEGIVEIEKGVVRIEKTNEKGAIVVAAPGFDVPPGTNDVRLAADVAVPDADADYSSGYLRAYGKDEKLEICFALERNFFGLGGGHNEMRGFACSAPGMTYRKYAHYRATEGRVTPVIVVSGAPSTSIWRNWTVEDLPAAQAKWAEHFKTQQAKDHAGERVDEAAFDRALAADVEHTAEIRTVDGVSRLFVDGQPAVPVVYKGKHAFSDGTPAETFAGKAVQGAGVRLMVKEIRLGWTPGYRGFWTKDGFDLKGCVREIKDAMRIADQSLFIVAVGCTAYPEFTIDEHPEETWRRADGSVVEGTAGSCTAYKAMGVTVAGGRTWPWVSYASRVWREAIKDKIRLLVAELKAQGLDKRIVGIQTWGYHDGQFTAPIADYSRPAQEEYKVFLSEPGHSATNYNWFVKQIGFRAQEEFARAFKQAMGKPTIAIRWCQSPLSGRAIGAYDLTSFIRSDAVDVLVAQPSYTMRRPGFTGGSRLPSASFHLNRKMYWDEFDLRTYGALEMWASTGVPSMKGLGVSDDFQMWQTVYRKHAGTMIAQRMGWWLFDMGGGWFSPPEIAADIGNVTSFYQMLNSTAPSGWRPDVAVVVDEAGFRAWMAPGAVIRRSSDIIFPVQSTLFGSSGVPYDVYLADDFMRSPKLADRYRMIVLGAFLKFDEPRKELVRHLAADGRTIVFLAESGIYGGVDATGCDVKHSWTEKDHRIKAAEGVLEHVQGIGEVLDKRNSIDASLKYKRRMHVVDGEGVRVWARYVSDNLPAIAERHDADCRRIFVGEAGGVTPQLFNRFARDAGAYVGTRVGIQLDMNGDFVSLHCIRPGPCDFRLPFPCRIVNLKNGVEEKSDGGVVHLNLTAGETCWFRLHPVSGFQRSLLCGWKPGGGGL